jgi:hypothetical protein
MNDLKVTDIRAGAYFGLKIFFVGRLEDNTILTIPFSKMLPLLLIDMESSFDYRGGDYKLSFVSQCVAATSTSPSNAITTSVGYVDSNISISALTVQDALRDLEKKLNDNYEKKYSTDFSNPNGAKKITYKINIDPQIHGSLDLVTKDSYAQNDEVKLSFTPSQDILSMIRKIVSSSKELNQRVADSSPTLETPFNPGSFLPVYDTKYYLTNDQLQVVFDVGVYQGGDSNKFTFEYYFADPGKNVDVLGFDVKFTHTLNWLNISDYGNDHNTNRSSDVPRQNPGFYSQNVVHPDTTRTELRNLPQDKLPIPAQSGDVAKLPLTTRNDAQGYQLHPYDAVKTAKLAFDTYAKACSALDNQVTFTVRGHLTILERLIKQPDDTGPTSFTTNGIWVKVNIYNSDYSQFYYTGWYQVLTIDNFFSGGKFTQLLTVMMMSGEQQPT